MAVRSYHTITTSLAVAAVDLVRRWNTRIVKTLPTPVVLEDAFTVNGINAVLHAIVPEGCRHTLAGFTRHRYRGRELTTTRGILLVSIDLRIIERLAILESVVVQRLQRPLANEDREFAIAFADVFGLATDSRSNVLRICAGSCEEVDVAINHKVRSSWVERRPVHFGKERILKHQRDTLVVLGNAVESALDVGVDPVGAVFGQTSRSSEAGKVVRGLVQRSNGEAVRTAAEFLMKEMIESMALNE